MYDQWTIAIFLTMSGYSPAIFRGYSVQYIGVYFGTPIADNDHVLRFE